ncbi:hypothetical protein [uncultured Helicobacter sp.]|uniref:hypothetical protein n=1 Tax=uncultured Helicobacter sp. TaxID=175537 RepID=UPI00374EEF34
MFGLWVIYLAIVLFITQYILDSTKTSKIRKPHIIGGLDSDNVWSRSGARLDSLQPSDTNLPQANCNEMIESKASSDIAESKKSKALDFDNVWSRSGVSGDSLSTSDTNLPQANCNEIIESKEIIVKYIICVLCIVIANIPLFFTHYSFISLIYAFFDAPSIFCVLIVLSFVARTFAKDMKILLCGSQSSEFCAILALKPQSFVCYSIFGALLLLGTLNMVPILDIYHFEPIMQNLFVLGVVAIMVYRDMMVGIFFALSCVVYFLGEREGKNLIDVLFCPYLWVYSVGYTFFVIFVLLKKHYEKRVLV